MNYKIWNKKDKINNVECETVKKELNIKEEDEVILILSKTGRVENIHIKNKIIDNYDLDVNLTAEEVAQKYLEIIEQLENSRKSNEDEMARILALESENKELKEGLQAVLRGDMQSLAYALYPQDFNNANILIDNSNLK